MKRIFVPAQDINQWQALLADPAKHWRLGFSARTLAHCWQAADGFPPEVHRLLQTQPRLQAVEPLLILPEYPVELPGRGAASKNDLFVLAKAGAGQLVSVMVEGKVSESFGQTVADWLGDPPGANKQVRLTELAQIIGLPAPLPDSLYYQLLHRTASAVLTAREFNAPYAVMIVHSFSQTDEHWDDFAAFVQLYGQTAQREQLAELGVRDSLHLFVGWTRGTAHYLSA